MTAIGREKGMRNPAFGLDAFGFKNVRSVWYNPTEEELVAEAVGRGEGQLSAKGAFRAATGKHTGRSAKDKYIVRQPAVEADVWWESNSAMAPSRFYVLLADFLAHAESRDLFVQDLVGGADPVHNIPTRVVTEYAWHSLFIRNLLIRPERDRLSSFMPKLTIVDLPSFRADPVRHGCRSETIVAVDLARRIVLIGGTEYAGEIKKSVFTMLNYLLPGEGILPMHCSANEDAAGATTIFFGLSGTGKTTLSNDPARTLIGDDEHGWGENGVFNFEGGCYAKTIRLSREAEPAIFAATERAGTVLENVVLDESGMPDFDDGSLTENTRAAYPLHFIANASATGRGSGQPKNVVMLTADAFGVLPPIARLTPAQAMYHFLSGYTAKLAGTERGVTEPEATFSTCFGAPFLPRHPTVYGDLLRDLIARHQVGCWLINTGWTGGPYGTGTRMPIKATRTMLAAALDGALDGAEYRVDPHFGLEVPLAVPGVDSRLLDPRATWADGAAYDRAAEKLVAMFIANFKRFEADVGVDVRDVAPAALLAAE